jgi:hypothetical protein
MYDTPSDFKDIPGEEEEVIALTPDADAPSTIFIAAISDSACTNTPPSILGIRLAMYADISVCGVIGYPK